LCPPKSANETQNDVRTCETRQLLHNTTVRRLTWSVACELSFLVFHEFRCNCVAITPVYAPQFSSTCSNQSDKISLKLQSPVSLVCPHPNSFMDLHTSEIATACTKSSRSAVYCNDFQCCTILSFRGQPLLSLLAGGYLTSQLCVA
jgi:hypothetical protein